VVCPEPPKPVSHSSHLTSSSVPAPRAATPLRRQRVEEHAVIVRARVALVEINQAVRLAADRFAVDDRRGHAQLVRREDDGRVARPSACP
jgi:hypothetical protein